MLSIRSGIASSRIPSPDPNPNPNPNVYQVSIASRTDAGWGSWSASEIQHLTVEAPDKFCTLGDFTTSQAFAAYSEAVLRPGMPVKCREAYHGKNRDIRKGAQGTFKTSNEAWPPALVEWSNDRTEYWVSFKNIELDVEAFDDTQHPELGTSLDLAELAIGSLGKAIQDLLDYEGYDMDSMLQKMAAKQRELVGLDAEGPGQAT